LLHGGKRRFFVGFLGIFIILVLFAIDPGLLQ
jgi:hypothetical protein